MDVSVIIVNYNVRDFLNNALISITKSLEGLEWEIFVVDNASDDGSVELLSKNFPSVKIINNPVNVGFAKANNEALAQATGKYFLLINPDTLVQEGTISTLIRFFERQADAGMVGCKILNPDGSFQLPCRRSFPTPWTAFTKTFGLSTLFPASKVFARYNLTYLDPDDTYAVDAISGSFMMVRKDVYEKIGGLDESFFMYGEDLDWCYRVKQGGWKVFYVPSTSIIHYKGESTRRSDIDELKVFYNAMRLFVKKHHSSSPAFEWFIYFGIYVRKVIADFARVAKPLSVALIDIGIVNMAILFGEYIRRHNINTFPEYAYPWIYTIPAAIVAGSLFFNGVYTEKKLSISRSFVSVFIAFVLLSAFTAFVKEFAFSRAVVLVSGGASLIMIPGWRLMLRILGFSEKGNRTTLFGRKTLIVGIDDSGQEIVKKLRARSGSGYSVVGFIDVNRLRLGEKILDVEILGSIETIQRIIDEKKISEVIFASDAVPYSTILTIISRNTNRFVNFRLVPNNLEVIIGKSSIDQLDEIPFIDIEYNIAKTTNRVVKRLFDLVAGLILLISVSPFVYFFRIFISKPPGKTANVFLQMPRVVAGSVSLVGHFIDQEKSSSNGKSIYRGKPGLIHINDGKNLSFEEKEQYDLYYAKNQSFLLDLEILVRSLQRLIQR
ncbi:MAG: glycosyltransferase [Bacteroidota bacterium]